MARAKYAERFCSYCNKPARMEQVGEMEGVTNKMWFRCCRCHHTALLEMAMDAAAAGQMKGEGKATVYQPADSFEVGQAIFHSEWNDTGTVISKMKTSDGGQAIIVAFEKQGQRRLVENLKPEPTEV